MPPLRFPRAVARISASILRSNYRALERIVPGSRILPMVKADAYGHGAAFAARALLSMRTLHGFGVATLDEGAVLRESLGAARVPIVVFSGAAPWTDEKGRFCARHALTPVLCRLDDLDAFLRGGWAAKLPYELKFNTGMNRLGIPFDAAGDALARILRRLGARPRESAPSGVLSHLASAEAPGSPVSRRQLERFEDLFGLLKPVLPRATFHLANSSAIWNSRAFRVGELTDVVRPGISLYGVPPWPGAPARGIRPVLRLSAPVIDVRAVRAGESVGYGATFTVRGRPARVAILAMGYADGLHRAASGRGRAWIQGRPRPLLGIVSMDLAAIACGPRTRAGDRAELLGPGIDPWRQARDAGTVPYELLTSLSARVQRAYV